MMLGTRFDEYWSLGSFANVGLSTCTKQTSVVGGRWTMTMLAAVTLASRSSMVP